MNAEQRKSKIAECVELAKRRAACRSENVYVVEIEIENEEETAIVIVNGKHSESGELRTFDGIICYSEALRGCLLDEFTGTIHHAVTPDGQVDVQCPPLGSPR